MSRKRRNNNINFLVQAFMMLALVVIGYVGFFNIVQVDNKTQIIEVRTQTTYNCIRAKFLWIDITRFGTQSGYVNVHTPGEYRIVYKPFWTTKKYTKIIKVVDKTGPKITLKGSKIIKLTNIDKFEEPGYEAIDNYDGDVTADVKTELIKETNNLYSMRYRVMDSTGNLGEAIRKISIDPGTIYLTFDDGPSENVTPQILKILKENNVNATFFVVEFNDNLKDLIKEELKDGNTVGLHGASHNYAEIYVDIDTLMNNFYEVEKEVSDIAGGYHSKLIRFPGGSSNTVSKKYCEGIMTEASQRVLSEGYQYFDWNVDSGDAGTSKTSEDVYNSVISGLIEGQDNIILMHDFGGAQKTADALQSIIDYCKEKGYTFKAITQSTTPIHHAISN